MLQISKVWFYATNVIGSGENGSMLSREACAALGVPVGSRWGAVRQPVLAGGEFFGQAVGDYVRFDEAADDEALLRHVFRSMDATNRDGTISREELDASLNSSAGNAELVEALKGAIKDEVGIDIKMFKEGADQVLAIHWHKCTLARTPVRASQPNVSGTMKYAIAMKCAKSRSAQL